MRYLKAGSTSRSIQLFVQDASSATGQGLTGLAYNTSGLTIYYALNRAASVAISLATQTVTGAWASGGFVEIDATNMPGYYRLDLPNAAIASGDCVSIVARGVTNMLCEPLTIRLGAVDDQVSGVALSASGLDAISMTPAADITASTFPQALVWLFRAFFKKHVKDAETGYINWLADDGTTVLAKSAYSTSGQSETVNAAVDGP